MRLGSRKLLSGPGIAGDGSPVGCQAYGAKGTIILPFLAREDQSAYNTGPVRQEAFGANDGIAVSFFGGSAGELFSYADDTKIEQTTSADAGRSRRP